MATPQDFARWAVAQSVYSALGAMVKTSAPDNLRGAVDADALAAYLSDGTKQRVVRIGGAPVGTLSVVDKVQPVIFDEDAFQAWAASQGLAHTIHHPAQDAWDEVVVDRDWVKHVQLDGGVYIDTDGCAVDGVQARTSLCTTARGFKADDVLRALGRCGMSLDAALFGAPELPEALEVDGEVAAGE